MRPRRQRAPLFESVLVCVGQHDRQKVLEANGNDAVLLCVPHTECFSQALDGHTQHNELVHRHLLVVFAAVGQLLREVWRKIESHLGEG